MAELILTEEEKQAPTYLEWDDTALAAAVRKIALAMGDEVGKDALGFTAPATLLIATAISFNADRLKISQIGVSIKGEDVGDWEVIVRRQDHRAE